MARAAVLIRASRWPFRAASPLAATSAAGVAVDVVHMHFEVVVPGELLVAELALCQRAIGVVSHLVSDQHFLQAKSQVTHLEETQRSRHLPPESLRPHQRVMTHSTLASSSYQGCTNRQREKKS